MPITCAPFVNHPELPDSLINRSYRFTPSSAYSIPTPTSTMPASITVLYPNVDDATFDMKYYTDSHMPMVQSEFKDYGFKGQWACPMKCCGVSLRLTLPLLTLDTPCGNMASNASDTDILFRLPRPQICGHPRPEHEVTILGAVLPRV